jgi:pSer/pThr/pTyr-binding forkhead associated (FHA) protein
MKESWMASLLIVAGPNKGSRIVLDKDSYVIGRHPDCDIVVPFVTVCRRHFMITRKQSLFRFGRRRADDKFVVKDLESRSGTYLNLRQIRQPMMLSNGDRISIGVFEVVFESAESEPTKNPWWAPWCVPRGPGASMGG